MAVLLFAAAWLNQLGVFVCWFCLCFRAGLFGCSVRKMSIDYGLDSFLRRNLRDLVSFKSLRCMGAVMIWLDFCQFLFVGCCCLYRKLRFLPCCSDAGVACGTGGE